MKQSLDNISLFATLSDQERTDLESRCRWRQYRAQEQIIDQDSESHDLYIICEGFVRVVIYSLSGREISFDDIGKGGFFGEMAAIDDSPRSANVVALEPTLVAILPQTAFLELITSRCELALPIMRRLVEVVRQSTMRIMDLSTLGANNRVMAEILREARPNIQDDNSAAIAPIPIHAHVASRASTTRETVARVMSDLTKRGLIRRERNAIVILDVEKLEDMVEQFHSV